MEKMVENNRRTLAPYDKLVWDSMMEMKPRTGFKNFHAHPDRADSLDPESLKHIHLDPLEASNISLMAKQKMVGNLHTGVAYSEDSLLQRMRGVFDWSISCGVVEFWGCIDVSPDLGKDGLLAWQAACCLRAEYQDRLKIMLGPNPIFGFKRGTDRWPMYVEAAKSADFLVALPEKDLWPASGDPDGKIGFKQHIMRVLKLAIELGKPAQFHLDQTGDPGECGTETLLEAMSWLELDANVPPIWSVHMISPSGYGEARFRRLLDGLLKYNVGVVVCPSAGLSMRCLRPICAPTRNSMARVMELMVSGVPLVLGTDNIADLFVPSSDGDMMTEIKILSHAVRFYQPHIWAKVACGVPLNDVDRDTVWDSIAQDIEVFHKIDPKWEHAVPNRPAS